jgi:peptidylamidoglycolate lyase
MSDGFLRIPKGATQARRGEVVSDDRRPSRSASMYGNPKLRGPHLPVHDFLPVNGKGGEDISGPYAPVDWPRPVEDGWRLAGAAALHVFSPDRIMVVTHFGLMREKTSPYVWGLATFSMEDSPYAHHCLNPEVEKKPEHHVVVFDRSGDLVESWTWNDHLFGKLNRVFVDPYDPEEHVWVTDSRQQKVFKFTRDGRELVMTIGEVEAGSTPNDPWKGQDVAWLPNGDFFTAGLGRIDRFSRDGELQYSILRRGDGPGEFQDLHGLVLDRERHRIYVADRGNSRIQVLDEDFEFIEEWPNILAPYALRLAQDGFVWVGDGETQKFLKYDLEGRLVTSWGQLGVAPGAMLGIHWFDVDDEGTLYVAENHGDRVQKLVPRVDVDPSDPRFIGPLVRY